MEYPLLFFFPDRGVAWVGVDVTGVGEGVCGGVGAVHGEEVRADTSVRADEDANVGYYSDCDGDGLMWRLHCLVVRR